MMRAFRKLACAGAFSACVLGCVEESRVIIAPRAVPEYQQAMDGRGVPVHAKVSVYPPPDAGTPEARAMNEMAHAALVEGLKAAGCHLVPPDLAKADGGRVCVVELAECRHDTPERGRGGEVFIVTVVAVRVRKPGVMRDGRIDCGPVRSFQGVCRMSLGVRPLTFSMSCEEQAKGVAGAVGNMLGHVPFRSAVEECGGCP